MSILKPHRLQKGDVIGLVSPSSAISSFPKRTTRAIEEMKRMGFVPMMGKNALKAQGHNAGTAQERADDIHAFFRDPEVKGVICTTGGFTSNAVLPLLDYDLIKNNPKVLCGYSDITALLLGIYAKTSLVTFNGPTLLPSFGECGGMNVFTENSFMDICCTGKAPGVLAMPSEFSDEMLWWEKEDTRPLATKPATPWKTVCPGRAEGRLVGGNLNTLCAMLGSDYLPTFKDSILFLEDQGKSTSYTERQLQSLDQAKMLIGVKGLIFGRPYQYATDDADRTLYDILREWGEKYEIPVLADVDCGHTQPMHTFPIGVMTALDVNRGTVEITESATL